MGTNQSAQMAMPDELRSYLNKELINQEINGNLIKRVIGQGTTAITYLAVDNFGRRWALKLVTRDSYGDSAPFREIARFSEVNDDRFLVFPQEVGDYPIQLDKTEYKMIWFKSRLVKGLTLEKFLAKAKTFSVREEINRYLDNIAVALDQLHESGFRHGDLHGRNIMREVIGDQGLLPEVRYVIIDFSEAYPVELPRSGLSSDVESYGSHLRSFYDSISLREHTSRDDEKILLAISHIPGLVAGTSAEAVGISNATQVRERFHDAMTAIEGHPRQLLHPFASINSDTIANDALLADLCYTKMSWVAHLENKSNLLVVGPRGCGKTMLFRRLRLKTKISAKKESEYLKEPYVAFYIPCESLFYMRFSDLTNSHVEEHSQSLVMFFNMAILAELSSTLAIVPERLCSIPKGIIGAINSHLAEEIGSLRDELGFENNATSLNEIANRAEQVMRHIRKQIAHGEKIEIGGSTIFTTELVDIIKREIPQLFSRFFIFLLDDYTDERVPIALQEALHPIVSQRSPDLCFKISAHMFGSIYSYPRPLALDEGRNIEVLNLGTAYVKRNLRRVEGKVLIKILDERLRLSKGYDGTMEEWLGV